MNAREREQYLREYSILKGQGKPFFPYAVVKDSAMAAITIGVIIADGDPVRRRARPQGRPDDHHLHARGRSGTSSSCSSCCAWSSRRSWSSSRRSASPRSACVLLLLLPFFDRNPERHPLRRPIATVAGIATIAAMAYLTVLGALAGAPTEIELATRAAVRGGQGDHGLAGLPRLPQDRRERQHAGPEPDRDRQPARARTRSPGRSINPTSPMPSLRSRCREENPEQFDKLVEYVASLKGEE